MIPFVHGQKRLASPEHADTLSLKALREFVTGVVDEVRSCQRRSRHFAPRTPPFGKTMRRCGWKTLA